MGDLQVDYHNLEASERTLRSLKSEFDGLKTRVGDLPGGWGHGDVSSAMHEFSHNMDYHRRKLTERIAECGDKVSNTLETFRASDAELAKSFDRER